jgi:hypothetical protein
MAEDFRVHVRMTERDDAADLVKRLEAMELEHEVMQRLGSHVVVSRDGPEVFLYTDTEEAARESERVVRSLMEEHDRAGEIDVRRWHPDAEDWETLDKPLPSTEEEREAERAQLMEREAEESEAEGFSEWEVRIELSHRREAAELERRLESEGLPVTRRWRFLLVGALNEEEANELGERLRAEAPPDSDVRVEGTFRAVQSRVPNPFAFLGGLGN